MFIRMNIWRQIICCWSYFVFYKKKKKKLSLLWMSNTGWNVPDVKIVSILEEISFTYRNAIKKHHYLFFFYFKIHQILIHIHRFIGIFSSYFIIIYREKSRIDCSLLTQYFVDLYDNQMYLKRIKLLTCCLFQMKGLNIYVYW
jgi:hypothetical protein